MKRKIKLFLALSFLTFFGCNEENGVTNPNGIDPFAGGNNGNVSFQVSIKHDQQHGYYFHFIPSVDVKITKVDATIKGQTSSVNGDENSVITASEGFSVTSSTPEIGDQWSFKITGKIAQVTIVVLDLQSTIQSQPISQRDLLILNIEISSQEGQEGSVEFLFKPNDNIKITKVDVQMGGASDVINGDGTTVYVENNWYTIAGYTGVESGQQWSFKFSGTIVSNNQNYTVTSNYMVP